MTKKIVIHVIDDKDFEEKARSIDLLIMMDRLKILGITTARHSSLPTYLLIIFKLLHVQHTTQPTTYLRLLPPHHINLAI